MELIFVGLAALFGGFVLGVKHNAKAIAPALRITQAIDRANFLQTLRRELANIMVWRNPQRYLLLYRQINSEVTSLKSWRPEEVQKRLIELTKKNPDYSDFDAISSREYVLYSDGVSMLGEDEIEQRYRDIIVFAALSSIAVTGWKDAAALKFVHTTDDGELTHLTAYAQKIEDTKLIVRIERAMNDYALAGSKEDGRLSNNFYTIIELPHLVDIRYGIHLKNTNDFCIYSFFVHDGDQISYSYYRSDPTFAKEQFLTPLHPVLEELKFVR